MRDAVDDISFDFAISRQAANSYKLEKLFKESGDAFAKEADCREKQGERDEAANAWWNAAKSVGAFMISFIGPSELTIRSPALQYKKGHPDREEFCA